MKRSDDAQLHVLISAYACEPGHGSEAGIGWNWVQHLSSFCRITVITRTSNRTAIEDWLSTNSLENATFQYVDVPSRLRFWKRGGRGLYLYYVLWQFLALRRAKAILSSDPFSLAHHLTFGSLHMPTVLQRLPVPLVYGPVGGGELGDRAFWGGGLQAMAYEKVRTLRMRMLRWDPFFRRTVHGASCILTTTPESATFIPSHYAHKSSVMPAVGVESSLARQPVGDLLNQHIYTAGRLLYWKGTHLGIRAFALIADEFPEVKFRIVGGGPQRPHLEELVRQEGLEGRVIFEDSVPRTVVQEIAASSLLFLFPSLHDSGGMAVLEAMAAAKPVICLDLGGPGLMVTEECGFKVEPTTPDQTVRELAQALRSMISNEEERAIKGRAARERVLSTYAWDVKAGEMAGIYRRVLSQTNLQSEPEFSSHMSVGGNQRPVAPDA